MNIEKLYQIGIKKKFCLLKFFCDSPWTLTYNISNKKTKTTKISPTHKNPAVNSLFNRQSTEPKNKIIKNKYNKL